MQVRLAVVAVVVFVIVFLGGLARRQSRLILFEALLLVRERWRFECRALVRLDLGFLGRRREVLRAVFQLDDQVVVFVVRWHGRCCPSSLWRRVKNNNNSVCGSSGSTPGVLWSPRRGPVALDPT